MKEKYARLKVYCDRDPSVPRDPSLDAEMKAALDEAGDESERTCEVCGEPGTIKERGRYFRVRCGPCDQIDEISAACGRIGKLVEGLDLAAFSANENIQYAVRLAMVDIGHAASDQPPASRARLPCIDWERLDRLKAPRPSMHMPTDEMLEVRQRGGPRAGKETAMKVAGSTYDELVALRSKTVFERAKLLAASGDRSRLDMTAAHVLSLLERFPVLYREAWATPSNAARPFARDGFDVSDGWYRIVERMSAKLAADPSLHVDQLKEKWGRLTVYLAPPEDAAAPAPTGGCPARSWTGRSTRRKRSPSGHAWYAASPGQARSGDRWVTVLCGPCVQLFEISETCRSIAERLEGLDLAVVRQRRPSATCVFRRWR